MALVTGVEEDEYVEEGGEGEAGSTKERMPVPTSRRSRG